MKLEADYDKKLKESQTMHDTGGGVYPCMIEVEVCIHA